MSSNPFFLTHDLEVTAKIPESKRDGLEEIRSQVMKLLSRAFSNEALFRVIQYDRAVEFFEEQRKHDSFTIAADGGIYVKNPNIAFDSTRMYPDEKSILEDKHSYTILTRDGKNLETQKIDVPTDMTDNVGIYDDGLFSGDTLRAIFANLPNGVTKYRVSVLLNFSGKEEIGNSKIQSLYSGGCIDWIDERDFYYGVENSGASIFSRGLVSGVPYTSSPRMSSEKASIPPSKSKEFCLKMLQVNRRLWQLIDENRELGDVPRLAYLLSRYPSHMSMQDVLVEEEKRIQSS